MKNENQIQWFKILLIFMVIATVADTLITSMYYNPPYADEGSQPQKDLIMNYGLVGFFLISMIGLFIAVALMFYLWGISPYAGGAIALYIGLIHTYGFATWIVR